MDFQAGLPRWHLSGARRPASRLQWEQPGLTFPATPHGIQPHIKSLCNSHSSCEQRPQPSTLPWLVNQDGEGAYGRSSMPSTVHNTNPGVSCCMPRADTVASSYRMTASSEDEEQGKEGTERLKRHACSAPKDNKSVTVSGSRRQMDPFLAAVYHFC